MSTVQEHCDRARELLNDAWRQFIEAALLAEKEGDEELAKALMTQGDLSRNLAASCIMLPRLQDRQ